jgi:lipooligosaccharide transport system permease protein
LGRSRAHKVLERDVLVYRRNWTIIVTGFFEPIFYLLGIGFGLGTLVGDVGDIPYAAFVAPGLMATAAMNGALFESTFNLFFKLKYAKTFDAILSTPLGPADIAIGEVSWALTRGFLYAAAFLGVMLVLGLVLSPWGILMVPGALLIGLAAASIGMASTTFMRKWQDFDLVTVVTMPLFLFSGTFFPISVYPDQLEAIVEITPLYRGVHMLRSFSTGEVGPMVLFDIAYLSVIGLIGVTITARRLRGLLLK